MNHDLGDRQKSYEDAYDTKIISRLPIIVRVDGRGFTKLTRDVPRPFCYRMSSAMAYAMFETIKQIDSALFGYTQSDEISFILWNKNKDADPWFNNRIQKVAPMIASMVTYYFKDYMDSAEDPPNIKGPAFFDSRMFAVPTVSEAINNMVFRQQDCRVNAISSATMAELGRKYDRAEAGRIVHGKSTGDRIQMLKDECGINFENEYPSNFRWGIATYKAPKIVETPNGTVTRTKWILDVSPPDFTKDRMFFIQLFQTGSDIFRADRDL